MGWFSHCSAWRQASAVGRGRATRRGFDTTLWGQIRNGRRGRQHYQLQILRKNVWTAVGAVRLTNDSGIFMRTLRLKRGALLRVWAPPRRRYSLQVRIR